ncbi:uncharacterized protein EV154DRAFT_559274 [Mucor mucedo]|uniref:uncharacterized protein n=1 Tax=Mucor mucedo TaxID=29922 RepID=UPI00221F36C6|nr:uncharacterized protein EV154DRAFT_559274 [Mucor mucedo]KAI7895514.1 hypothetical protein EV154DRAFT_559274 [Mucor mucedo]
MNAACLEIESSMYQTEVKTHGYEILKKGFPMPGHWPDDFSPLNRYLKGSKKSAKTAFSGHCSRSKTPDLSDHGSGEFDSAFSDSKYYKDKRKAVIASRSALNFALTKNSATPNLPVPYIIVMRFELRLCFLGFTGDHNYTKKLKTLCFNTTINYIHSESQNLVEGLFSLLEMRLFPEALVVVNSCVEHDAPRSISKVIWDKDSKEIARKREMSIFDATSAVFEKKTCTRLRLKLKKVVSRKPVVKNLSDVLNSQARQKSSNFKELYFKTLGQNNIIDLSYSSKGSQLHLLSNVEREAISKKPFFMPITNYRSEDFSPLDKHLKKIKGLYELWEMCLNIKSAVTKGIKRRSMDEVLGAYVDNNEQLCIFKVVWDKKADVQIGDEADDSQAETA